MSSWESNGKSDEWYTPKYVFDALGCEFDLDVCYPKSTIFCHVPCKNTITEDSLSKNWKGFVWMNPPFGGRNGLIPWLDKIYKHGDGIALTPDRTSAPWWPVAAKQSDCFMFIKEKIKFIRPDGSLGKQPGNGTTLFAYGERGIKALLKAQESGLGTVYKSYADL